MTRLPSDELADAASIVEAAVEAKLSGGGGEASKCKGRKARVEAGDAMSMQLVGPERFQRQPRFQRASGSYGLLLAI
ncbi:hypothetical protein E2562_001481 [Oryza meyeriana var. granulata]|uniref:Uncharacterized protein n=1 Tax=Oryza meyeriana var. granulata TaxID=110450 RepID=A0A6G1DCT6_9ORYZ|nr:hypothetical protein E2562_001481 [Oryza meyeriana var. granulata]